MTRGKVELSFIANTATRKATFRKRKVGLLKKAEELSTLCGVDVCAIVHNPYDPMPVFWPNQESAKKVVDNFLDLSDEDQNRKMLDHPGYLNERILKSRQRLAQLQDNNFQNEMALLLYGTVAGEKYLNDINPVDLKNLLQMIDHNVGEIYRHLSEQDVDPNQCLQAPDLHAMPLNVGSMMPSLPPPVGVAGFEMGSGGLTNLRSHGEAPRIYEAGSTSGAVAFGDGPL